MSATSDPEKDRFYTTVGDAIREAREAANLSTRELADQAGIHRTNVVNAENGDSCSLYVLARIATALDTTLDALVPLEALA